MILTSAFLLSALLLGEGEPTGLEAPTAPSMLEFEDAAVSLALQSEGSEPAAGSEWDYLVGLYLFGANINGTVNGVEVETPFSDTWENLDAGGSAFFHAHRGNWGYQVDLTYMSISDTVTSMGPPSIDVQQDIGVAEADLLWRIPDSSVDVLLGLRYFDIANEFTPQAMPTVKSGVEVLDPVLGVQWGWDFAERWRLWLRGDVGGFGIGSKLTYQALASIDWQFAGGFSASAGYRVLGYDFDEGGVDLEDMRFEGVLLGLGYRF